jgi:hypothetical protein
MMGLLVDNDQRRCKDSLMVQLFLPLQGMMMNGSGLFICFQSMACLSAKNLSLCQP